MSGLHRSLPWWQGPMTGFDLETTSVDPEDARMVGAAVVDVNCGAGARSFDFLIYPEVPIPPEATAVHGITDDDVREVGAPLRDVAPALLGALYETWGKGWPVVIYNASFDLTVLDRALRRLGMPPLEVRGLVVDPFILDVMVVKKRRRSDGGRKLWAVAKSWGADTLDPTAHHSARRDTMAALRIAYMIGRRTELGHLGDKYLMHVQQQVAVQWRRELREWFATHGREEEAAGVREELPLWTCESMKEISS